MNDENQARSEPGRKPVVLHPGPLSIEDLLRHVDPAPDDETERFVAAIYMDRRNAGAAPQSDVLPLEDVDPLRTLEDRADLADAIAAEREALEKGTTSLADLKRDLAS